MRKVEVIAYYRQQGGFVEVTFESDGKPYAFKYRGKTPTCKIDSDFIIYNIRKKVGNKKVEIMEAME
ncbi:MAG: hypothetical protein ACE5D6_04610 [Candidatus Zixiibacteriota bacterium]